MSFEKVGEPVSRFRREMLGKLVEIAIITPFEEDGYQETSTFQVFGTLESFTEEDGKLATYKISGKWYVNDAASDAQWLIDWDRE